MTLHDMIFEGVSRARMLFFHQNASGRILNRFSKDIGSIDSQLPVIVVDCIEVSLFIYLFFSPMNNFFQFFLELIGIVTIVAIINYWLLFPTLFMCLVFYALRHAFLTTARNVKRVEAISK